MTTTRSIDELAVDDGKPFTVAQAAHLLGVCPESVRRYIDRGQLPAFRTRGGHYRISVPALREFLLAEAR